MNWLDKIKDFTWAGNSGYDYLIAALIFIGLLIVLKLFQMLILARLHKLAQRTKTDFDDVLINIFRNLKPPFYFLISLYMAVQRLTLPDWLGQIVYIFFLVVIIYEVIRALEKIVEYSVGKYLDRQDDEQDVRKKETIFKSLKIVIRIILWAGGLLIVLENLGIDITALIAGLGVGGVAVALALQKILGDIFSSFSILVDKPFLVGDFIIVGKDMGTVEKIGLKTTRIQSLQGEQIVISNQELTSARIHNYKRMEKRRVDFALGVVYGTDYDKLLQIPDLIKSIIDQADKADFDRCHFKDYGDFSLNFEIVYFAATTDYNEHMDLRQKINLAIYQKFQEEGIEFAYPTQKVLLKK